MFKRTNKSIYDENEQIFKFIKSNDNDILSEMSGIDLQELIILIDNYYLTLREQLGLEKEATFGLEIEVENAKREKIESDIEELFPTDDWRVISDSSLDQGAEINSPILRDTKEAWESLKKVCDAIKYNAIVGKNSGGHIHVGTHVLGNKEKSWLNFIRFWSAYENIIFRFSYGEFLSARPKISNYADPMTRNFWRDYEICNSFNLEDLIFTISHKRHQAVNFNNVSVDDCDIFNESKNTIEFRCPNSSLEDVIWQNKVNFFVKMLEYCKSKDFNEDIVEKRHQLIQNKYDELKWYNEIYLEQALELCDMIYSNNLDKIYFLKQYLKSLKVQDNSKDKYVKSVVLTKKK